MSGEEEKLMSLGWCVKDEEVPAPRVSPIEDGTLDCEGKRRCIREWSEDRRKKVERRRRRRAATRRARPAREQCTEGHRTSVDSNIHVHKNSFCSFVHKIRDVLYIRS